MLLDKARQIAGVTWVERVTKALPATDIDGLAALCRLDGARVETDLADCNANERWCRILPESPVRDEG